MYGKNSNRPFPHYAPVSKHKELRTRLRWTISCKSLYFESFSISRRPKSSNGFFIRNFIEIRLNSLFISSRMTRSQILHIKLMHLSMLSWRGGGGGGGRQGIGLGFGDLTFFKNLPSNSFPSFQSIATKFPHPGMHIAVHPKAGPKKGTIKISPNKTLQSFFYKRYCITKDRCSC